MSLADPAEKLWAAILKSYEQLFWASKIATLNPFAKGLYGYVNTFSRLLLWMLCTSLHFLQTPLHYVNNLQASWSKKLLVEITGISWMLPCNVVTVTEFIFFLDLPISKITGVFPLVFHSHRNCGFACFVVIVFEQGPIIYKTTYIYNQNMFGILLPLTQLGLHYKLVILHSSFPYSYFSNVLYYFRCTWSLRMGKWSTNNPGGHQVANM